MARREDASGEWRVGKPADVGRSARAIEAAAGEVAEVEQQAAECGDPEAEGVQAREGHVARADHEGNEVVAEAEQNWHADEEDHRGAVHGEEAVEGLRGDEVVVGDEKLDAHQYGFNAGDDKEDEGVADVHQADLLMVDGRNPVLHLIEPGVLECRIDCNLSLRRHGLLVL